MPLSPSSCGDPIFKINVVTFVIRTSYLYCGNCEKRCDESIIVFIQGTAVNFHHSTSIQRIKRRIHISSLCWSSSARGGGGVDDFHVLT